MPDALLNTPAGAAARLDRILHPITIYGAVHYGEAITQVAHALQCARLAQEHGCAPAMIAAALLHDVGQFIDDAGSKAEQDGSDGQHETIGAAFLRPHFGPEVTEPVRLHVAAKRYLCAVEPGYRAALSAASELSLALQGGPLSGDALAAFEAEPFFADAILLRRFDDGAKRPDWAVPPLETYRPLLAALLLPEPA
jgi:phosphonate degradation associated HDIG domain protein